MEYENNAKIGEMSMYILAKKKVYFGQNKETTLFVDLKDQA